MIRDYCLLQLLYDSGARATEIATLNLDYINAHNKTLAILGKGNRFQQIELETKTIRLLTLYIGKYCVDPKPVYQHWFFINQCGKQLTRHGIYPNVLPRCKTLSVPKCECTLEAKRILTFSNLPKHSGAISHDPNYSPDAHPACR